MLHMLYRVLAEWCFILERGLPLYVYYVLLLFCMHLFFILYLGVYGGYLAADSTSGDIWTSLVQGTRLSMQTAGFMTLFSMAPFVVVRVAGRLVFTVVELWTKRDVPAGLDILLSAYPARILERAFVACTLFVTMFLFMASLPYYEQFHSMFHQTLFQGGANGDTWALLITLWDGFDLPLRLIGVCILTYLSFQAAYLTIFSSIVIQLIGTLLPAAIRFILLTAAFALVCLWTTFGGALSWQTAIDWENVGITKDSFLNEAMLDPYQALYRAYRLQTRFEAGNGLSFTADDVRLLAAARAGMPPDSTDLSAYLQRTVQTGTDTPPSHVFLIISESYAAWPLSEAYKDLPIAADMRALIDEEDSIAAYTLLPNGSATVSALTGIVTGLADANLYLTTRPASFAAPYLTAAAPQLAKLGYETTFFYAGPATWENITSFTEAQGFDRVYSRGDFAAEDGAGNVWGIDDVPFYEGVLEKARASDDADADAAGNPAAKSFCVLLNTSNHSPYTVPVFDTLDKEALRQALPEKDRDDEWLLSELGHYWYATKALVAFVKEVKARYPDALIAIVGDHADRYNLEKTPAMYERFAVPLILTGHGIRKGLLPADAAGSHIDIMPTLLELIAPQGYAYYAVGRPLQQNKVGVNYGYFIQYNAIGEADKTPLTAQPVNGQTGAVDEDALRMEIDAIRGSSWWLPSFGVTLDDRLRVRAQEASE
ncbi:hypothetical protein TAMA11512_03970 [Selenomonas sp. TAMA-11512]|uniref:LTA synthase family protein n=1 Tax=Selenomonas sp. TAMA-11512 TaxID=3095337 RepID=UPI00308AD8D7|nr:hypothetical protein TAMA11512_03970 [Selenomonas sp. TAMA-11512]